MLLWAGSGYIYILTYSAFAPRQLSVSSEVEAMEQSSEPDQLALLALGTTAALVLFLKLLQRGRARKVLAPLLDLCKNVLVFSSSAFFSLWQDRLARASRHVECHLRAPRCGWTSCCSESFYPSASVGSVTPKRTLVEFMPPLLTLWLVSMFPYIHESFPVCCTA